MLQATAAASDSLVVEGTRIDVIERGAGRPVIFLHAENGIEPATAAIDALAHAAHVIAPTHPGFGRSELPKDMRTVDDLSYFYLDLLDQRELRDVTLVGVAFGAWIAAEIAVKSTARLARLQILAAGRGACCRARPRSHRAVCLESVFPQSAPEKPTASHSHSDAVLMGRARSHGWRSLWQRLLRDDPGRPLRNHRTRRAFSASGAAASFR